MTGFNKSNSASPQLDASGAEAAENIDSAAAAAIIAKISRRILPFVFLLYILAYLDRVNVGFAALEMKRQLGFSDAVYGLGAGIFFIGYFLFEVPSNLILARVGARRWIARIMITWGLLSACTLLVRTAPEFYVMRFLLGAAEAGFFPGILFYFTRWFPAQARARTIARFMTAPAVAAILGGPVSGLLLQMHDFGGLAGWQWLFLLEGIPSCVCGVLVLRLLTESPQSASWLSPQEKAWLAETLRSEQDHTARTHGLSSLRALAHPRILFCCVIYLALTTTFNGLNLWLPQLIQSASGANAMGVGLLITIPFGAACAAMMVWGAHSDREGERRWHTALAAWLSALALALAAFAPGPVSVMLALTAATAGIYSALGPFWAIPSAMLTATAAAGGIALINSVGNLGGFFGSYALGIIKTRTGSYAGGLLALAACGLLCGILVLLTPSARARSFHEERIPTKNTKESPRTPWKP